MIVRLVHDVADLDFALLEVARFELVIHPVHPELGPPAFAYLTSMPVARIRQAIYELSAGLAMAKGRELARALDQAELVQARATAVAVEFGSAP